MTAARRWRDQLAEWAIPQHITAAVDESPWQAPAEAMVRRTDALLAEPAGRSLARSAEALDPPGTVLDVGAGAGAASLPLARRITRLVAVDENERLLPALTGRAAALGLPVRTIVGRWPDITDRVSTVDVVVCHHVCYNVPDLAAFAVALAAHARRRVVIELTERHPMAVHNPLWKALHGLDRPEGPTATDAIAVLREAGLDPQVERWSRPRTPTGDFDEVVEMTRRAICLPRARVPELVTLLPHAAPPHRDVVTLWWDA